ARRAGSSSAKSSCRRFLEAASTMKRRRHGARSRATGLLLLSVLTASGARAQTGAAPDAPAPESPPAPGSILPPRLLTFAPAEFPPSEIAGGRGATVVLQISIDASGRVASVAVVGPATPAFDAAAVAAAGKLVFAPATANGVPIPVTITYRYQ